jgi:hypothetical protein
MLEENIFFLRALVRALSSDLWLFYWPGVIAQMCHLLFLGAYQN